MRATFVPTVFLWAAIFGSSVEAQVIRGPLSAPTDRITQYVDENRRVTLRGNVHPLTLNARSHEVDPATAMDHMVLTLRGDNAQEARLQQVIEQQHDPASPLYRHFLTPAEFGAQFGVSTHDIQRVTSWLTQQGFHVEPLPLGRRSIVFSGTAGQVAQAFHAEIRKFDTTVGAHLANATDPQIPLALADVVGGVVKLHDFRHARSMASISALKSKATPTPNMAYGSSHYLAPADYAAIYDLNSLYSSGNSGAGQGIAVIARSNIAISDVQSFRQSFALPANDPTVILVNQNPGVLPGDSDETTLDTEWSGAVAPAAKIQIVVAASTSSTDGIDLSALYAVNHKVAPVITVSYGSCEAGMGSAEMSFYNSLWQQAAAQGQSVMVSSGDSGAAGCNGGSASSASIRGVNGLCSSPYSTCVGGTEFAEGNNPGQYWHPGNNSALGSAVGYIPETVWNESGSNGGSGLWASGGGSSIYFNKPSWQTGPGVPADGARDVPDVSLTAAGHDGYIIVEYGQMYVIAGTSAAAPSFAGIVALVNQKNGSVQGSPNANLYALASLQSKGGAAVFHDTTTGSNSVPGLTGFTANTGYDRASGLGSVDGALLVSHWNDATTPAAPKLALSASANNAALQPGNTVQVTLTSQASAVNASVTLTLSKPTAGLTATLASTSIAAPGSGSVALTLSAASSLRAGTYPLTVTAQGAGQSAQISLSVTVTVPSFSIKMNTATTTVIAGSSSQVSIEATPQNGFNNTVSLSLTGAPSGLTGSFAPAAISGANGGVSALTLTAAKSLKAGSYSVIVTAAGGAVTQQASLTVTVSAAPTCTLLASPTRASVVAGSSSSLQVACGSVSGTFTSPLTLSVSGQPAGVTAAFAQSSMAAGASTILNLTAPSSAQAGTFNLLLQASATGFAQSLVVPVTLTVPSTFTLSASQTVLTLMPGTSAQFTLNTAPSGGFNANVSLGLTGIPAGVSATLSRTTFPGGTGSSTVGLTVNSTVAPGTYTIRAAATGGGFTQSVTISLKIPSQMDFVFSISTNALSIQQGGDPGTVVVSTGNFTGGFDATITISFSGLPVGFNYGVLGATTGNNMVNISEGLWAATSTPVGTYPITIQATGAGITHSAVVNVTVTAPGAQAKH